MVAIPKYLGVKMVEDRNLESILEKTGEMDIGGGGQVVRGIKRVGEREEVEEKLNESARGEYWEEVIKED